MKIGMTDKEKEIIVFIKGFIEEKGYSPTVREIAKGVNLSSTSSVYFYLSRLREVGHINYIDSSPRTVTICGYKTSLVLE